MNRDKIVDALVEMSMKMEGIRKHIGTVMDGSVYDDTIDCIMEPKWNILKELCKNKDVMYECDEALWDIDRLNEVELFETKAFIASIIKEELDAERVEYTNIDLIGCNSLVREIVKDVDAVYETCLAEMVKAIKEEE